MILPSGFELLSGMSMYCDVSAEVYRQRACKRCLQHEGMMRCMCGPNDFVPIGTMRKYDRLHTLPRLTMPTLFHGGQWDEAVQQPVEAYSQFVVTVTSPWRKTQVTSPWVLTVSARRG